MKRFLWLGMALLLMSGCGQAREIRVGVAYNNLSDSYVYPYMVKLNGKHDLPDARTFVECSNGHAGSAVKGVSLDQPPRFIVVEWLHMLTRKAYRARILLGDEGGPWWRETPFRDATGYAYPRKPRMIIQWRGSMRVRAMVVADVMKLAIASLKLGEAEGEEITLPRWVKEKAYFSYTDIPLKYRMSYFPGTVWSYQRTLDGALPHEKRYGCPRLHNGQLDTSRLPPQKLPYLVGANGEHIPCRKYICSDMRDLVNKLRRLGWRDYTPENMPPPIEFGDGPNPRPAR